jgi:hypothetical protein
MTNTNAECGQCAHFRFVRQGSAQKVGECRRNAPNARTDGGPQIEAAWPMVLERDGCGEFKAVQLVEDKAEAAASNVTVFEQPKGRTPRRTTKASGKRKTR